MAGLETLDEFSPKDTDPASLGDDAIRETRAKTKTSVGMEHSLDGTHKIPGGPQGSRPAAGRAGRLYFNTDLKTAEYDTGTVWSSAKDAKARATILWRASNTVIPSGANRMELPFDYIIDDPGSFALPQYNQIIQPENSMGLVSAYVVTGGGIGGFGFILAIEQFDGTNWQQLVQAYSNLMPFLSVNTVVDSRWGKALRVTVMNGGAAAITIAATALGASPRFAYALLGRTA
jgi:hypothetical protein